MGGLFISPQTRAQYAPGGGLLNISMDFNAAPSGSARGTEVIIPDNAPPEVRAAAERYNAGVAAFAAQNGIANYPVRGVRTTSENGRGVSNTVHVEPFFNSDSAMQQAIQANPAAFAEIYRDAFGGLSNARLIAPHGVGNDRGAASDYFGDETSYGELIANTLLGNPVDMQINGGAGSNVVQGGAGNDMMEATMPTRNMQPPMTAAAPPVEEGRESIWKRMGVFKDDDRRERLAMALAGMTLNPNEGLMRGLDASISARAKGRAETKAQQEQAAQSNQTLAYIRNLNTDQSARAYEYGTQTGDVPGALQMALQEQAAGQEMPASVVEAQWRAEQAGLRPGTPEYQQFVLNGQVGGADNPNVQSSEMLPDASGSVLTMRDGSLRVATAGGDTLTGQDAMDFVEAANRRGVDYERDTYGARREGTLTTDITLGGEAARVQAEGVDVAEMARDSFEAAGKIGGNIGNIDAALDALNRGADAGMIYNNLPRMDEASATLQSSMDRMGLDVIGSVTFGALSASELNLAMQTAVPRNLSSEELEDWLTRRRDAQVKAQQALYETSAFFANGGTMSGYLDRIGAGGGNTPAEGNTPVPAPAPQAQQGSPNIDQMSDDDLLNLYIDGSQ